MRTFSLSLNRNDFHFLLWSCWAVSTSSLPGPRGSEATTWPARQCSSGTCWICPPLLGDPGAASGAWFLSNVKLLSALHSLKGYSCELEECVFFVTQASLLYLSPNMDVFLYFLLWNNMQFMRLLWIPTIFFMIFRWRLKNFIWNSWPCKFNDNTALSSYIVV